MGIGTLYGGPANEMTLVTPCQPGKQAHIYNPHSSIRAGCWVAIQARQRFEQGNPSTTLPLYSKTSRNALSCMCMLKTLTCPQPASTMTLCVSDSHNLGVSTHQEAHSGRLPCSEATHSIHSGPAHDSEPQQPRAHAFQAWAMTWFLVLASP